MQSGMAVIFLEIGQDVHFTGGILEDAVNEGVRAGYTEGQHAGSYTLRDGSGRAGEDYGCTKRVWQ